MSCERDISPTSLTSTHLDVSVSCQTPRITLEIFIPNVILESYLDTLNSPRHIECITQEP